MTDFQYTRIACAIRDRIAQNLYPNGRLPSERELMVEFSVQRDTVRRAFDVLESEGLVYRDATRGRFATPSSGARAAQGTILLAVRRTEFTTSTAAVQRGMAPLVNDAGHGISWLDLLGSAETETLQLPAPDVLRARGVAGIALWPEMPANLSRLKALRAAMPLVLLDRRIPGFESDFVGFDDAGASRTITAHLIERGHRRIGFMSAEPLAATVEARVRGWGTALEAAGIAPEPEWILHQDGGLGRISPERLMEYLNAGGDPLTAVVCANDTVAARLIYFLKSHGKRVPDDLVVTGFGNVQPPLLDALGLTTMAQPFEEMGRAAAKMLLSRLRGKAGEPRDTELPMELVVRDSPPRK